MEQGNKWSEARRRKLVKAVVENLLEEHAGSLKQDFVLLSPSYSCKTDTSPNLSSRLPEQDPERREARAINRLKKLAAEIKVEARSQVLSLLFSALSVFSKRSVCEEALSDRDEEDRGSKRTARKLIPLERRSSGDVSRRTYSRRCSAALSLNPRSAVKVGARSEMSNRSCLADTQLCERTQLIDRLWQLQGQRAQLECELRGVEGQLGLQLRGGPGRFLR